jgi:hypothetical protein
MWIVHGLVDESYLGALTQLGMLATAGVTFAPMPSIAKFAMSREIPSSTFHMLILPYFTLWAQNMLWTVYGALTHHRDIFRVNLFATSVTFIYVTILYFRAPQKEAHIVRPLLLLAVAILAMTTLGVCGLQDEALRIVIISWAAIAFNVFQVLSPTKAAYNLLTGPTDLLEGFPVALTVAGFVSASLWTQYSLLVGSVAYLIPNLLGVICNGAQIAIVLTVFNRLKQKSAFLLDSDDEPTYSATVDTVRPWQAIDCPDVLDDESTTSAASTPVVQGTLQKGLTRRISIADDGGTGGMPDL